MDTSKHVWHLYPTQEQAFEAQRRAGEHTMVTSMDKSADGKKTYAVTSLAAAYAHCMSDAGIGKHQYELLMATVLLRVYFDAEFSVALNPALDKEACLAALLHYMQCAYREIPNRPVPELQREHVVIETSHRPGVKASYHGKLDARCGIVADMTAQRAFWARVIQLVEEDIARGDARALMLRIVSKRKLPNGPEEQIEDLFWDRNVYTKHRLMRFLGACKWTAAGAAPSFLVPEGKTRADITFDVWRASLVTARFAGVPDAAVVLDLPAAWFALAASYWQTPVVAPTLPLAAKAADKGASDAVIQAYLRDCLPFALLVDMATMKGLVQLAFRHLALAALNGSYTHHFEHATPEALKRALHARQASAIHVGEATADDEEAPSPWPTLGRYTLREFCVDVDVTDYDGDDNDDNDNGVRWCVCANTAQLCDDCWYLIEAAAVFLKDMVTRRMGIAARHILWVYSGSKGIHMWVNAPECLYMTPEERAAVVRRFVTLDLRQALARDTLDPVVERLFTHVLVPHFVERAIERRQLLAPERRERVLTQWAAWVDDFAPAFAAQLRAMAGTPHWDSSTTWYEIVRCSDAWLVANLKTAGVLPHPLYWIVGQYAWPRIDAKVTTERRRTLKSPFSVHGTSHCVALPIEWPGDGRHSYASNRLVVDAQTVAHLPRMTAFQAGVARLRDWCQFYHTTE